MMEGGRVSGGVGCAKGFCAEGDLCVFCHFLGSV